MWGFTLADFQMVRITMNSSENTQPSCEIHPGCHWLPFSQLPFGDGRNLPWNTVEKSVAQRRTISCCLDWSYHIEPIKFFIGFDIHESTPLKLIVPLFIISCPFGYGLQVLVKLQSHCSYYNYQTTMELETTSSNQTWINEHKENTHI